MDYYYDYDEEEIWNHEYNKHADSFEENTWENISTCIQPSLEQTAKYIAIMLLGNILCRFLWYIIRIMRFRFWLNHVCSVLCGFGVLYFATGYDFIIVLFLCLMAYVLLRILVYGNYKNGGIVVTVAIISTVFTYEAIWSRTEIWQRIRGVQMIAVMKIISIAFDVENKSCNVELRKNQHTSVVTLPELLPYLGYIFFPATCVMGPWIPYNCYMKSLQKPRHVNQWIFWIFSNCILAVIFLSMSNCIVPSLCHDKHWKWLIASRDALSVRCSHYFICFVSQAMLAASGVTTSITVENKLFGNMITKPWNIEFPRSLSSLVRFWNIPMHDWLKNYIFRVLCKKYNNYPLALIITYVVSSLLHGIHLRIYLVLLSLSICAYAEYILRHKLANTFCSCISANPCKGLSCKYTHCPSKQPRHWGNCLVIWSTNLIFGFITMLNLAYFGIILNYSEENKNKFDIREELYKWSDLGYMSHWLALALYLFYWVI